MHRHHHVHGVVRHLHHVKMASLHRLIHEHHIDVHLLLVHYRLIHGAAGGASAGGARVRITTDTAVVLRISGVLYARALAAVLLIAAAMTATIAV